MKSLATKARILAHFNHWNMTTTDTNTIEPTAAATATKEKDNCFLGLYFPKQLKQKVSEASKAERRSMSQYAVMVFEKHFANA